MRQRVVSWVESTWFSRLITGAIVVAGAIVGLETEPAIVERIGRALNAIDSVVLWLFAVEASLKLVAWRTSYFRDPWNVFDFTIVTVAFLPIDAGYVAVLRLVRLLRVLRLVRAIPRLQVLVGALLSSLPSMGWVAVLLALLFYVYGVAGVFMFGANDPVHFGHLPIAMLSLFRVVTGDAWTDLLYINLFGCGSFGYDDVSTCVDTPQPVAAVLYFTSFVLIGAMVMLNLFIGVILAGMEEAKEEDAARAADDEGRTVGVEIDEVERQLDALAQRLRNLKGRV